MTNRPPTLLAVFAHPDDEVFLSGGTLALLARRTVHVQVLTATRGEVGSCGTPPLCTPDELGAVREAELRCACAALGIAPPHLLDYRDGTLHTIADEEGAAHVLAAIHSLRPQALLTWPPDGLSGHFDHMAVNRWTLLALAQTDAPHPSLYYLAAPALATVGPRPARSHAVSDDGLTLAVDVGKAWEQKSIAIRCHRTQAGESPILDAPNEQQQMILGTERFTLAAGSWDLLRSYIEAE